MLIPNLSVTSYMALMALWHTGLKISRMQRVFMLRLLTQDPS